MASPECRFIAGSITVESSNGRTGAPSGRRPVFEAPLVGLLAICWSIAGATSGGACDALPACQAADRSGEGVRTGLSNADWAGIVDAYEAGRHAVRRVGDEHWARNPRQDWRTCFDGRAFLVVPDHGSWSWGLQLVSYGFSGSERPVAVPAAVDAAGGRIAYAWDPILTEWFVNDSRGLEHGYTVRERPDGETGPLTFTLAVRGELCPEVDRGGRDVRFINASGAAIVEYAGLAVLDADGLAVPARFESAGDGLRLTIDDRGARYPLTIDPIAQQAYLKASNTGSGDRFGAAVAASGDTVVVGADLEDSSAVGVDGNQADNGALDAGAVYVFVRDGATWSQQAYLKASNTASQDYFGYSVAVSGDTIVVGAVGEDSGNTGVNGDQNDNGASRAGAAYMFVRIVTSWSQQAYIKASNTGADDYFGASVSVSGDTAVVGAYVEDSGASGVNGDQGGNGAPDSGAAYIFVRSGGTWSQQAYLKASNTGAGDRFGWTASLSGDTAVVGAVNEDSSATGVNGAQGNDGAPDSGAAYVFVRSGTMWSQQAYLKASNTETLDWFGWQVSVSGDTVAAGAPSEDSGATGVDSAQGNNDAFDSGAAYVFVRSGDTWSQQAYVKASNTDAGDAFGATLAVSDDLLAVGAPYERSNATGVNGNQGDDSAFTAGAAYLFVRSGAIWSQEAYLKASNAEAFDSFSSAVAASGDVVVAGAPSESSEATGVNGDQASNGAFGAGAAYVFALTARGDFDGASDVDGADLGLLLGKWGSPEGDLNGDGMTDGADLGLLLGAWTD